MRTPLLAGNWKMNLLGPDVTALLGALADGVKGVEDRDILVCPAFPYLETAVRAVQGTRIRVGAQNCGWETSGAFTGEVSPEMLKDLGCSHVILGHSERRQLFEETDERIHARVCAAVNAGLDPVLCVGETLEEREADRTWEVVARQLERGLETLSAETCTGLVVAYEPVWAIGTGRTATPDQAQHIHRRIRDWIGERHGHGLAASIRIVYGGSMNPGNVDGLMAQPDIDGGLVGGASLNAADFTRIVNYET